MGLETISFSSSYHTGITDLNVVEEFYIPALRESISYDRISGYFSSSTLASAGVGIAGLVENNGKMRLITSHSFTTADADFLSKVFDNKGFEDQILKEFEDSINLGSSLADSFKQYNFSAMCWLLKNNYLEIKIVVPSAKIKDNPVAETIDKYHPKLGIFKDEQGNNVAFSGSINETYAGWNINIENFDVYRSWVLGNDEFINSKIEIFDKFWKGDIGPNWVVLDLPKAVKESIISKYAPEDFPIKPKFESKISKSFELRDYQKAAVDAWIKNSRVGILEMATGTGKTRTAYACYEDSIMQGPLLTVIVTPYQHISEQWASVFQEENPIFVDSANEWRSKLLLIRQEAGKAKLKNITLVALIHTAKSKEFVDYMEEIRNNYINMLLIVDEAHWAGAPTTVTCLYPFANFRLGLSATPNRYFDDLGSNILFKYFEKSVYELDINNALKIVDSSGNKILS